MRNLDLILARIWCIVLQPILRRECGQKAKGHSSPREKNEWSHHQCLFEESVRKTKKEEGLQILKIRVRELFTHGEGISIPRARHKERQPLIECAKHDFKIVYFPFFIFFFYFFGSTRVLPLLLHILRCNEEFRPT